MLVMKDMRDSNSGEDVHGREDWQIVKYNGWAFTQTEKFAALLRGMRKEEEKWMKGYSAMIDCMIGIDDVKQEVHHLRV